MARKTLTRGQLNKKIQTVFNRYIRLRDCLAYGGSILGCACISCGTWYPFEKLAAGHYVSVGSSSFMRFNEQNVHAQCAFYCNVRKSGNPIPYGLKIDEIYGKGTAENLYRMKDGDKLSMSDLREKLEYYKDKVKELEKLI